jgi:hypothetical protein
VTARFPWQYPNLRAPRRALRPADNDAVPLFAPRAPLRPMIVVMDASAVAGACRGDALSYLLGLTAREPVRRYLFADDGPPAHLPRQRPEFGQGEAVAGWVTLRGPDEHGSYGADFIEDGQAADARVGWSKSLDRLIRDTSPPAAYLTAPDPAERMKADALARSRPRQSAPTCSSPIVPSCWKRLTRTAGPTR